MTAQNEEVNCLKYRKMKMFRVDFSLHVIGCKFSGPITEQSEVQLKQSWFNFNTPINIAKKKKFFLNLKKLKDKLSLKKY